MTISRWIPQRMRNDSNKSCKQNQNTHFKFSISFPKIVPFMRSCRKICWKQRRCKWQYSRALHAGVARVHERKHTPALVHAQTYTHVHAQTHTRAPKHAEICNTFFSPQQWFRERIVKIGIQTVQFADYLLAETPNTVHSCSRHDMVAARFISQQPGGVLPLPKTFPSFGVLSWLQWLCTFWNGQKRLSTLSIQLRAKSKQILWSLTWDCISNFPLKSRK
jgi:hypothetical protein